MPPRKNQIISRQQNIRIVNISKLLKYLYLGYEYELHVPAKKKFSTHRYHNSLSLNDNLHFAYTPNIPMQSNEHCEISLCILAIDCLIAANNIGKKIFQYRYLNSI